MIFNFYKYATVAEYKAYYNYRTLHDMESAWHKERASCKNQQLGLMIHIFFHSETSLIVLQIALNVLAQIDNLIEIIPFHGNFFFLLMAAGRCLTYPLIFKACHFSIFMFTNLCTSEYSLKKMKMAQHNYYAWLIMHCWYCTRCAVVAMYHLAYIQLQGKTFQ